MASSGAIIVAAIFGLAGSCEAREPERVAPIDVKVLVLNFDPVVVPEKQTRLTAEARWTDPRVLAAGYAEDVKAASGGLLRYKIVDWMDLDEFPVKTDGFVYTVEEYMRCRKANQGWHQPDGTDYPRVIAKYRIVERVEKGEIDEVWWFGGPYFGYSESAMAGRGAFYINGGVYGADKVPCSKAFAIMGFNYERGVAEMLHDLCHRTESTMGRVFGGWQADRLDNDWARFAANAKQSNGFAGAGSCHYPANAEADYDYGNKRFVDSTADDWLNYPNLTGAKKSLNCEAWGGPDYQRNYLKWWFARLPRAAGVNAKNGRLNNWWEYVFHFNQYDDRGQSVRAVDAAVERRAAEWALAAGGSVAVETATGRMDVKAAKDLPSGAFEVSGMHLPGRPIKDGELSRIARLSRITHLNLGSTGISDKGLTHLRDLSSLTWLSLSGTRVVGTGLPSLAGMSRLSYLELNNLALTNQGLAKLPALPDLRELHLTGTKVTDAGMKSLGEFPRLSTLSLANTGVTDGGLAPLTSLKELKVLFAGGTKISDAGIRRLKESLPNLEVRR